MTKFSETDQIPYRYGLDELPADITRRELLYFFSFGHEEKEFIAEKSRFPSYQLVMGIHLGAYRFIGKPQYYPENTPYVIIRFVADTLGLGDGFVPLKYSDRERTRREHARVTREFLELSHFTTDKHQLLIEYLIQKSPDPGHIPDWIKSAEDFLRTKYFVLPSVKALRRLILSARHQSMERVILHINSQIPTEYEDRLEEMLKSQGETAPLWNSLTNKNIYSATPAKLSEALGCIKDIRELELKKMDLGSIPYRYVRHLAQQGLCLSAKELRDYSILRRRAIVAVTLRDLESELTDIAIQMNDEILSGVFQRGENRSKKYFRKHRRVIQRVVSAFRFISDIHLDESLQPFEKIDQINEKLPPEKLRSIREETEMINVPRGSEKLYFASQGHTTIQKYLPALLETFKIVSSSKKDPVLEAVDYYLKRRCEGKGGIGQDAPTRFIQEARWKRIVFDSRGGLKTKPWVLCLADRLRTSFRQGSLEIEGARQYQYT